MKNRFGCGFVFGVLFLLAFSVQTSAQDTAQPSGNVQDKQPPACKAIRTVQYPVTKMAEKKTKMRIALLDLCPPNRGMVARPLLPMMIDGKPQMFEYDVVRVFKNKKEADKYAKENNIKDVEGE